MDTLAVELKSKIEAVIAGEIKTDNASRVIYSTDASIYQQEPLGVVYPKIKEDLNALISLCADQNVPVLPRGAGSSLAGQAVGRALVVDFSRYMNAVEEINPEEKSAWVQPGVVLTQFNQHAAAYGLQFGPDPASADRATFGGMFGNNSTGAHSILYGMSADHILELETVLADGQSYSFQLENIEDLERKTEESGLGAQITRTALKLRKKSEKVIQSNWPRTWRNASGYALNYLIPWSDTKPPRWYGGQYPPLSEGELNLAPVLVGSEGTLAVFTRMKINLVDVEPEKVLTVLAFDSIADASEATPEILEMQPSAVELVPRAILTKARSIPAYASRLSFLEGDPAALLLVEFSGEAKPRLVEKANRLKDSILILEDSIKQRQLWEVRKVGLGLLMYMVGDAKPIPFVEDAAVPVENLGAFVREFEQILADYGTRGDFYAHASAGCLHIRPVIDLKTDSGIMAMRGITREVVDLALQYGGALSGEHADGQARGEWLERVYGRELSDAFRELKQAADPLGILNPGKIVDPPRMEQNLRFGSGYTPREWVPVQDFSSVAGLGGAIEMCNGAGVCRQATGSMCPTFQASQNELHSTRGRANLLREMISGKTLLYESAQDAAFESLTMCLACKGCKAECPSAVDVAKLKYEFLYNYYQDHRRPLKDYLFGYIGDFARIGRWFTSPINAFIQGRLGKTILSWIGISPERSLPVLQKQDFTFPELGRDAVMEEVIFLSDPFSEYFTPDLLQDALTLLAKAGCKVHMLPVIGTGRTKISKGFLTAAKKQSLDVLDAVETIDPEGLMPLVGLEPSEISMLTDDQLALITEDPRAAVLASRSFSVEEFLLRPDNEGQNRIDRLNLKTDRVSILLHGHCHQKAQKQHIDGFPTGVNATTALFEKIGVEIELIASGCCGMAGAFGYESDSVEMSKQVAEMFLLPAVRDREPRQIVAAPGASCRAQIESFSDAEPQHPVSLLLGMLEE
jgi:FAD/FMN-containing dehydrogenase/Fe-S oxidoreductase